MSPQKSTKNRTKKSPTLTSASLLQSPPPLLAFPIPYQKIIHFIAKQDIIVQTVENSKNSRRHSTRWTILSHSSISDPYQRALVGFQTLPYPSVIISGYSLLNTVLEPSGEVSFSFSSRSVCIHSVVREKVLLKTPVRWNHTAVLVLPVEAEKQETTFVRFRYALVMVVGHAALDAAERTEERSRTKLQEM